MIQEVQYTIEMLEKLVNIPSPSGYTEEIMNFIQEEVSRMGFEAGRNSKGGLVIRVEGQGEEVLGIGAHADTLGAMIRSVKEDGTLRFTPIGGYMMETIEGEYCQVHCRQNGRSYSGTILTVSPSVHVYDDARTLERKAENMVIRLDEEVKNQEDVRALGIGAGDFVSFAPRFVYTDSGFIKSRHLDDKASVAVLMGFLQDIYREGKKPRQNLRVLITNYEEIGHGASFIPQDITEFLAVDMGAMGEDLEGDETKVSICAMDSSGPYDFCMTNRLIALAGEHGIDYAVDLFPHYRSDVSAALRGGNNIRGALIGQGVHASHGMERTHEKGLLQTLRLLKAYTGVN